MEALYRKYRPSTFADVVGQEHIERTLKNAIEQGKVSHAYLFCGPRGTGKTTTARILAKALLCKNGPTTEPDGTCEECQAIAQGTHPDVYELDAASRTGVENVREEIISRVSYAPTRGKWKVYIIDEVHMLSTAAFNALLKTIEEPPGHVAFILCTTDPQKVPETIQSRCQRFDFHRISIESIVSRLGSVCVKEGVEFEPEALELIAHRAEGGMRNALTTLEQLIAFDAGKVTLAGAQNLLGTLDDTDLSEIIVAIGKREAVACFNWLGNYVETGADLAQFVQDLAEYVRNLYLLSLAGLDVELQVNSATRKAMEGQLPLFGEDRLARMLAILGDVSKELRTASNSRLVFEIALTRLVRPESDLTLQALAERVEELERKLAGLSSVPASQQAALPVQGSGLVGGGAVAPQAQVAQSVSATAAIPAAVSNPAAPAQQAVQPASAAAPNPAAGSNESAPIAARVQQPAQPTAQASSPQQAIQPAEQPAPAPAPAEPYAPVEAPASASSRVAAGSAAPAPEQVPAQPQVSAQNQTQGAAPSATASAPQPVQQPSAPVAAAAASADRGEAAPSTASVPAPAQGAAVMTASIDVSNPAALQRFWRSVTATLRKVNPARGVLFMNAKILGEPNGKGIVIQFGKDGGFAYNAAQKTEVQELLAKTIAQVAGGTVPYRLSIEGGAAPSAPAAQPAASQPSRPARSFVPPAPAAASASQRPAPRQQPNTMAGASGSVGASVPPANAAATSAPAQPAATSAAAPAPAQPPVPAAAPSPDPVPYEEVPLDVYGASVPAYLEDDGAYDAAPFQSELPAPQAPAPASPAANPQPAAPAVQSQPAATSQKPSAAERSFASPGAQPGQSGQPASPASGNPAAQAAQGAPRPGESEADQIKSILTNSFGPGVKFEELPE